jgi:DNA-binding PucR family transcriptional regulator
VRLQRATASPESATRFEDLGVYKLLADLGDVESVEGFERRWLGRLLDYDAAKGTKLVETVAAYVECGGNYDATADALYVHRSTLRYRLQRLREISGLDLNDPDTRFNLQLATRAWTTLRALRQESHNPHHETAPYSQV